MEQKEGNRSADPEKYIKDAKILETALKEDPTNERNTFYLAQSYRDAGMSEKSLETYLKRASMQGWDEEVFYSLYSAAKLTADLDRSYEEIVDSYTAAYTSRPNRAEPLYHLALFFRNHDNFLLGYLTASQGLQLPKPDDLLFVETWIYEWGLLMEKSVSAYWLGRYQECLDLSMKILRLKNLPEHVKTCTEKNIEFTISKLQEQRVAS